RDRADRREEQVRQKQKHDQVAHFRQAARAEREVAAERHQRRDEELAVELEDRRQHRGGAREVPVVSAVRFAELAEEAVVGGLAREALRDLDSGYSLRERGRDAAEALLRDARLV